MGYLFLLIALFAGATKGYCGKQTSNHVTGFSGAVAANTLRMLICIAVSFGMLAVSGDLGNLSPSPYELFTSVLSGVSTSAFVILWLISVRKGAYMMIDVFCMVGVLIPIFAGTVLFDEKVKITQWIGIAILFAAVLVMCSYNNSIKQKMTISAFLLILFCGLSNGVTDLSQKMFAKSSETANVAAFNFYTYVFSAITLIIVYIILRFSEKSKMPQNFENSSGIISAIKPVALYIVIMSVCLFINSYFKTLAAGKLNSAELYPLNQGAALIISTLMSAVLFKEKIKPIAILGISLSFLSLIFINVL